MYNIFILRADGKVEHSTQPKAPKLDQLQTAVGGYIETVPYFSHFKYKGVKYKRGRAYANEEGILKGLAFNTDATRAWKLCYAYGYGLVGDIIFFAKGQP